MAFAGMTFCITGTFSEGRQNIVKTVVDNGGTVASSVTGKVTHLLCENEEGSTKWAAAKAKGIPIHDEAWYRSMLAGGGGGGGGGKKGKAAPAAKAAAKGKKRKADEDEDEAEEGEEEEAPKAKKAKATPAAKGKKRKADEDEDEAPAAGGGAGASALSGLTFCITGTLSMKRADFEKLLTSNGAGIAGSVTNKVTHLICAGDEGSSKYATAKGKGIPIVDEAWVHEQLSGAGSSEPPAKKAAPAAKAPAAKRASKKKAAVEEEEEEEVDEAEDMEDIKPVKAAKTAKAVPAAPVVSAGAAASGSADDPFSDVPLVPLESIKKASSKPAVVKAAAASFPADYGIRRNAVLQYTDVGANNNKYYGLELHTAKVGGKGHFRVYAHYGRTDDLASNPASGVREVRNCSTLEECEGVYAAVYREKTGKGYSPVNLASSNIGSEKLKGRSSGAIGAKTQEKLRKDGPVKSLLEPKIQELVRYLYDESTSKLTSTVKVTITARGIETPLGILNEEQVEKGEALLNEIQLELNKPNPSKSKLEGLSSDFYTAIPHKFGGRSAELLRAAIINSHEMVTEKRDTCQLMKDMLKVEGVLAEDDVDSKYAAMNCDIECLSHDNDEFKEIHDYILNSQVKSHGITVTNIYKLHRPSEWDSFDTTIKPDKLMFHGSKIQNWVGLLTRGILMPNLVVAMGGKRTDGGWLGHGIYFGDAACTAAFYTNRGKKGTRFFTVARVALGKWKDYRKITYGIERAPDGFQSCHGVRGSEFEDDEYVVYRQNQQRLEYLCEFTTTDRTYFD